MLSRLVLSAVAFLFASVGAAHACDRRAADPAFVNAMFEPGERRVAFVAGVGAYQTLPQLPNPARDAQAVSDRLTRLGFEVYAAINPNAADFAACFSAFEAATARASVVLFYFAGHGVQFGDANYVTVTDSRLIDGRPQSFFALDDFMMRLAKTNAARLIFLDACRDNPLAGETVGGGSAARSIRAGLAPLPQTTSAPGGGGQFVAYSTSPNATAADGTGMLSPFSHAFIANVGAPGVSVQRMMSDVTRSVGEQTSFSQTPWTRSSLTRDVYLNGKLDSDALKAASDAFAAESTRLLNNSDDRNGAIAAALKGIALATPDAPAFAAARGAYQRATRSLRLKLPMRPAAKEEAHAIISFDARRVMVGVKDDVRQRLSLWNGDTGAKIAEYAFNHSPMTAAWNIAFSPDGARAVTVDESTGEFLLIDANDGRVLQRFTAPAMFAGPDGAARGKYGRVTQLALSNGGAQVLVSATFHVFVWDVAARRVTLSVVTGSPGRLQADITRDGGEVVIAAPALRQTASGAFSPQSQDDAIERLHRFNAANGALVWSSEPFGHASPYYTASGRYVLAEVSDDMLVVWETRTGRPVSRARRVQGVIDPSESFTVGNTADRAVYTFPDLRPVAASTDAPVPVQHKVLAANGAEIDSFLSPRGVVWPPPAPMDRDSLEQRRRALPAPLATAVANERLRTAVGTVR